MKRILPIILLSASLCALSLLFFACDDVSLPCDHKHITSTVTEPTCDLEGYTVNKCVDCQEEYITAYTPPVGHTLTQTVFAPTCTEEGYVYYSCACGYGYKSEAVPPTYHDLVSTVIDATCESMGYTEYTCQLCTYSYKGNYVSAEGHIMLSVIHPPTENTVGYTEHTCIECGSTYKDEFVFFSDVYGGGEVENTQVLTKGIDVSVYQHSKKSDGTYNHLDWNAILEAGVGFAILKVGSGNGIDPVFEMNYADAKAAGMKLGAYFYCYATTEGELMAEIEMLMECLEGKQFEYPIYFDLEDPSLENSENREMLTKFCMTFVDVLRENGYYGALYSNEKWLENYLYRDVLREYCDIWYARYPSSEKISLRKKFTWNTEKYGAQLGMWQYSQSGVLTDCGIPQNQTVDFNYCYKDYESIIKKYGLNGFSIESDADDTQ